MMDYTDQPYVPGRGRRAPLVKVQAKSFWLGEGRDGFTAKAATHFEALVPSLLGITLQSAERNELG